LDGEIVETSRAIAEIVGGSVHAAHIYRPLAGFVTDLAGAIALTKMRESDKKYRAAVRRRFYADVDRYGIAKSRAHLICGDPTVALPVLARSIRAGLVVMGATSRSGLKRIFIGHTAERVLDALMCDILVVKPRG
jgi:universal stress protein E